MLIMDVSLSRSVFGVHWCSSQILPPMCCSRCLMWCIHPGPRKLRFSCVGSRNGVHRPETSCHAESVTFMSVAIVVSWRMCFIMVSMLSVSCLTSNEGQLSPPSFSGA